MKRRSFLVKLALGLAAGPSVLEELGQCPVYSLLSDYNGTTYFTQHFTWECVGAFSGPRTGLGKIVGITEDTITAAAVSPFVPITARLLDADGEPAWYGSLQIDGGLGVAKDLHISELTRLCREIFLKNIVPGVSKASPTPKLFNDMGRDYRLSGESLTFPTDLTFDSCS